MVKGLLSRFKVALNHGFVVKCLTEANASLQKQLKEKCLNIVRLREDNSRLDRQLFSLESDFLIVKNELEFQQREVSDRELTIIRKNLTIEMMDKELATVKHLLTSIRKQKVYEGQKFYNPKDHKADTVYICARWNEWLMIREQSDSIPVIVTHDKFNELYEGYVLMPRMNRNQKFIK